MAAALMLTNLSFAQDFTLSTGVFDSCTLNLPLEWNAFTAWPAGVERYEIWASVKSPASDWPGPPQLVDTVAGSAAAYDFYADDGRQHCIQILAIGNGGADTARSNSVCIDLPILSFAYEYVVLDSASVDPDQAGAVTLSWRFDPPKPHFTDGQLFRSRNGGDFAAVENFDLKAPPFQDVHAQADQGPVTYRIVAYDACGNEAPSNNLTTIFLRGEINPAGENILNWTPYQNDFLFDNLFYSVSSDAVNGPVQQPDPLAVYPGDVYMHRDLINPEDPTQRSLCYSVATAPRLYYKGVIYDKTTSVSNRVCLERTTPLFVPNAFAPDGVNREFRPYGVFGSVEKYSLSIYDRYGGLVFTSRDIATGWDGRKNGRILAQGVYVYNILLERDGGERLERWGDVLLVR